MVTPADIRYLEMARFIATKFSKDPSTKVGAVITRPDRTVAGIGYNGLPRGVADDERLLDRELKYEMTVHAELNAILNCREPLAGYTLYVWPLPPCARCATAIIQAGIRRVVQLPGGLDRWLGSCSRGADMLDEVGIERAVVPRDQLGDLLP